MSIFRAYDIRGEFGKDLTEEIAEKIGRAFGTYIKEGGIVVGRDCRLSSPALSSALINGLTSTGCDVIDVGMVPTPVLYFSLYHHKMDAGVMITGSHNPPQYNGFKICKGTHTLHGEEIQEIRKIAEGGEFGSGDGEVKEKEVVEDYIQYVKDRIKLGKRLKVVVDAGNGTAGEIAPRIFEDLGCEVIGLYCNPDGNFPNHFPDPTIDEALQDLISTVKKENADIGIAYDGDSDRLGVVDNTGNIIRGDQILMLLSKEILEKGKEKIIFDVKSSQAIVDYVKEKGGIPVMYRTGHSFIKNKMKEENAPLAGEMSGHFFIADNYYGYDDGIFSSARVVQMLSREDSPLSEIMNSLPSYYSTPEIRVHCPEEEKFQIVEKMVEKFSEGYDVITVDGVRVQFGDGWGLVRASNTEPAIILRFEAKTKERLEEIQEVIKGELRKFPSLADKV